MVGARLLCGLLIGALGMSCGGFFGGSSPPPTTVDDSVDVDATLYQRLGGVDVLRAIVDEWLLEASSDERIREYFASTDIIRLKLRLVERICVQVEGPCLYRGREMYEAHADLGIEDSHLRAFLQALEPAIQKAKMEDAVAEEFRTVIRGLAEELAIAVVR
jgi:hemoglobin